MYAITSTPNAYAWPHSTPYHHPFPRGLWDRPYTPTFLYHQVVHYGVPDRIRKVYSPIIDSQKGLGVANFVQAFAVAQAMYLASKHKACLFTDDTNMEVYLKKKCERAILDEEVAAKLGLTKLFSSAKSGLLAHRVLEPLPDLSFESYDDILNIREHSSDELERFRMEIHCCPR